MKNTKNLKNGNGFLITCVSCVVLLLTLCYFGINTSFKSTKAVTVTCGDKHSILYGQNRWCCPNSTDTIVSVNNTLYCVVSGITNASSLQLVAADNSDGIACTATTPAGYDELFQDKDEVCPKNLGSSWAYVSRVADWENNWIYTCSAPYTTCAAKATEPEEVVEPEEACYYNKNSNFYIWTTTTAGDAISHYEKASEYDTETNCEYANYKVAQYWLDTSKTTFYKGGGCWIDPGVAQFDGTCSLSDAVVADLVNPTKTGYTFLGWDDSTSCSSPVDVKSTIKISDDISYYACWKSNVTVATGGDDTEYTISYNANGGSGAPSAQTKTHGTNLTLSSTKPSRSNYTFKNWNTAKDGSGTSYAAGATYSANASATLYAQWTYNGSSSGGGTTNPDPTPTTYTFTATFNPNGGTLNGSSTKSCTTTGSSCSVTGLPTATKSGYTFKGWGTSSTCTSGSTSSLTLSAHTTYYACYTKNASSSTGSDGNVPDNPDTGEITIALVWVIGLFAIGYSVWYFKKAKQN